MNDKNIEELRNSIILLCADREEGLFSDKQLENAIDLLLKMFKNEIIEIYGD